MAKILMLDIETAPLMSAIWQRYDANAVWVEQDWYCLCVGYHWYGDPTPVECVALTDFPLYKKEPENDSLVMKKVHSLISEADILVAHNLEKFDEPKTNTRMFVNGMDPPRPYRTIDTLKLARKLFRFSSNRLGDLATELGISHKSDAGGYMTWRGCMNGDTAAWAHMIDYCKQDVVVLEELYTKMRPWIPNHPSIAALDGVPDACPKCGVAGSLLQRRGFHVTKVSKRQRYQCQECGGWSMGRKLLPVNVQYLN